MAQETDTRQQQPERVHPLPAVFTVMDAAAYLHMHHNGVRDLLKSGELRGWRTAGPHLGNWRTTRTACDEYIAQQEERARTR